jgi:predicted nucleic acid-binding protein
MSMPAGRWLVFDTNVYVAALREGAGGPASEQLKRLVPRTYLAAVVSAELHAGALDDVGRKAVRALVEPFSRLGRVVTPDARAWDQVGDLLAEAWRRQPQFRDRLSTLWNDALIALSARQIGAAVVTQNVRDFALLHRYSRFEFEPFQTFGQPPG